MATIENIYSLVRAHIELDEMRFDAIVQSIVANEKAAKHRDAAKRLEDLWVSRIRTLGGQMYPGLNELCNKGTLLVLPAARNDVRLDDLVLPDDTRSTLDRIVLEYRQMAKLRERGLDASRKILLSGKSGTGKTMSAVAIAGELGLPLYTVSADQVIQSLLGSTAATLRKIFDCLPHEKGVFFFDEFDSLARARHAGGEGAGEMSRVMGSLLQFMERDKSESIIIAATNMADLLDKALYRRFDAHLKYAPPEHSDIELLVRMAASRMGIEVPEQDSASFLDVCKRMHRLGIHGVFCHAEVVHACKEAGKALLLAEQPLTWAAFVSRLADIVKSLES